MQSVYLHERATRPHLQGQGREGSGGGDKEKAVRAVKREVKKALKEAKQKTVKEEWLKEEDTKEVKAYKERKRKR